MSGTAADAFADAARCFLLAVEDGPIDLDDVLRALLQLVPAATDLPTVEEDGGQVAPERIEGGAPADVRAQALSRARGTDVRHQVDRQLGRDAVYRTVFDPRVLDEDDRPVTTTLGDDLGDVTTDVLRGLVPYDDGDVLGAQWEWRFGYEARWGAHAANAICLIHWLVRGW